MFWRNPGLTSERILSEYCIGIIEGIAGIFTVFIMIPGKDEKDGDIHEEL